VDDDDDEVQNKVAFALRSAKELSPETLTPFVTMFLDSRAFSSRCGDLLHALERLPSFDASTSLLACERAVLLANADLGDIRTDRIRWGRSITRIVIRVYRQGDDCIRSRCLDLIDRLSELNAYGVSEELAEER